MARPRGFASPAYPAERKREVRQMGVRALHASGKVHHWTHDEAVAAGRKGGRGNGLRQRRLSDERRAERDQQLLARLDATFRAALERKDARELARIERAIERTRHAIAFLMPTPEQVAAAAGAFGIDLRRRAQRDARQENSHE